MSVRISRALCDELICLAANVPDVEVCGLLFGTPSQIASFRKMRNISSSLKDRFEIDPVQLIAAHKAQRAGGPDIIGCFHSHPNGVLEPSACDADAAMGDGALWLIIANSGARLWRTDVPGAFQSVALDVINSPS
jgi:desampylase